MFRSSINKALITSKSQRTWVIHPVTQIIKKTNLVTCPAASLCASPVFIITCLHVCLINCLPVLSVYLDLLYPLLAYLLYLPVASFLVQWQTSRNGSPPMTIKNSASRQLASELSYAKESEATGGVCREERKQMEQQTTRQINVKRQRQKST